MTTQMTPPENSPAKHGGRGQRRWGRVFLPALIILLWLSMAGLGGPLFGRIGEVSSNDQSAYLPENSESAEVSRISSEFYDSDDIPAVVVIVPEDGALNESDLQAISTATNALTDLDVVGEMSPPIPSDDGEAVQVFIPLDASGGVPDAVDEVRSVLDRELPENLTGFVTGPAGLSADLGNAFAGIDGLLLGVAFFAVLLILLVVYRSVLLPLAVLATSLLALASSILVVWNLANWGVFLLNGQTQGILFILVIGAATDYSLLYVSRYREELMQYEDRWVATRKAWRGTIEPVLASGGTVIAGLLCLLLSNLESNSVLGPVASVGIIFAMASALTLLPAILCLVGRRVFWPRIPAYDPGSEGHEHLKSDGVWAAMVRFVEHRSRMIWTLTTLALVVGALGALSLKADGVAETDLVLTASEARDGQEELSDHFPAGSGSPTTVLVNESDLDSVTAALYEHEGVDSVSILANDSPSGQLPITPEGLIQAGQPGSPDVKPTTVDGDVLLQVTLTDPAASQDARDTIAELRDTMADVAPGTLIGGTTATNLDTIDTSIADRNLIIPIILVVILVILMLLLRAIVAPILLIATTILSFGTAMGVAALVFNHVLNFPGADPAVPLYSFVFLVALGIDYNIFLMTRVREETVRLGTREGILRGLAITGTVITSAGVVLAATFAALVVIPILFLVQLAFIVAFGVLLDTFLVRTFLVPSLSLDIGKTIWWPSALSKGDDGKHRGKHSARVQQERSESHQ